MTGDIKVIGISADTNVLFKKCAPFARCITHKNDEHVKTAENLGIMMPMCNLVEFLDNYVDSSESLYEFKMNLQ